MAETSSVLRPTADALTDTLDDFITRQLPHRRIARLAGLLRLAGVPLGRALSDRISDCLVDARLEDGSWVDCEDTAWCAFVLEACSTTSRASAQQPDAWLTSERSGPAWGYCRRDSPCIPITATVRLLRPALGDGESATWLRDTWRRDLAGAVQLSYKGAWYLVARADEAVDEPLTRRTVAHLLADQRADGSWGPWRDHPAPTDCFATGIAMWALARSSNETPVRSALSRAAAWCEDNRLDGGLFATHYIEEGSAWLHLGWSAALEHLER